MEDALVLARTSSSVVVVHRKATFRASKVMAERVLAHPKISVRWNSEVRRFVGGGAGGGLKHAVIFDGEVRSRGG
jgi:thioredoxin reductase (NADPH)